MTLDPTTFANMLKVHYARGKIMNVAYDGNKAFAMMKKKGAYVGGASYDQPVGTALVGQGSSTFATANAATTNNSTFEKFSVPFTSHYRVPKIDNGLIQRTLTGSEDAFERALLETDRGIQAEGNWINFRIYRSRGGAIGRMTNTGFATAVMTVDDAAALYAVQKNDVIKLASTDGTSGAVRAGSLTVLSVQYPTQGSTAGSITFTGNISAGVAAAAANDYIFLDGDFGLAPAGFADYIPDNSTAAATALYGFTRSGDNRLGGAIVDGTNMSVFELITDMMTASLQYGGTEGSRTLFCNPFATGDLVKQLDGKWMITQACDMKGAKIADVGFNSVRFNMFGMEATLVLDRMCPVKRIYSVDMDDWTMLHAGAAPAFLLQQQTGNILKPSETIDGWECRIGEYLNFSTSAPHKNAVGIRS